MAGKSVLDVGAWDGYYTLHAEHYGASRVVALDHYAWSIDFPKAAAYMARQLAGRQPIRAFHTVPELWDPVGLPGKRGFDLASRLRNSRAEVVVDDFMTMDVQRLGTFDVVLFLGVIYHLEEPLRALRRLRQVTRGVAVIESEAVVLPRRRRPALAVRRCRADARRPDHLVGPHGGGSPRDVLRRRILAAPRSSPERRRARRRTTASSSTRSR